ncbi:MAG: hypothetical protein K2K74_13345 [Lachnospiraceae bacterium]|nr:hypothetical protein [Lachnospiraceae bacterium]
MVERIHLGARIEDAGEHEEPENSFRIILNGSFFLYVFPEFIKFQLLIKFFQYDIADIFRVIFIYVHDRSQV